MPFWAPVALTATTAALLAVPVAPALYELRKRRDAAPLPTSRHDGKIENFAEVFASRLEPLRPQLEHCRITTELSRTSVEGMQVLLVGTDDFDFPPSALQSAAAVMCAQPAIVPAGTVVEADIYAGGSLELGDGSSLRAALCEGDVVLGRDSAVLRWLHARGNIYLQEGSAVYGRLSTGRSICLKKECVFERMHAAHIFTVDPANTYVPLSSASDGIADSRLAAHICHTDTAPEHAPEDEGSVFASSRQPRRVRSDFVLPAGATLDTDVIATGTVHLGRGSRLLGSAKSYKDVLIEENACVHGSVVSEGSIRLGPCSFVAGPVLAEAEVLMERSSCVGGPNALTTVSAPVIQIATACELHGTVFARQRGSIKD